MTFTSGQFWFFRCFTKGMDGVQNNSVNSDMKGTGAKVGILTPPNSHYKPELFNEAQASRDFNKLDRDIYERRSKIKFEDTKSTPAPVKYILCAIGIIAGVFGIKALVKNIFRFKK